MPLNTNFSAVLPLITTPRLSSFITTFKPVSDHEIYGVYIWNQHAAGAIYPLLQNLEITLRNAIDREATRRFGQKWWDNPALGCRNNIRLTRFYRKIEQAITYLNGNWENEQRRLNKTIQPIPVWSHDKIIAATDFSAWHFILKNEFSAPGRNNNQRQSYLWPLSTGRCFRQYNKISTNESVARTTLQNTIVEFREYRNRLFHHEPVWIKAPHVTDASTAIDTIRNKIKRIGELIEIISPEKHQIMLKMGLFSHALRVCSFQELEIYNFSRQSCQFPGDRNVI